MKNYITPDGLKRLKDEHSQPVASAASGVPGCTRGAVARGENGDGWSLNTAKCSEDIELHTKCTRQSELVRAERWSVFGDDGDTQHPAREHGGRIVELDTGSFIGFSWPIPYEEATIATETSWSVTFMVVSRKPMRGRGVVAAILSIAVIAVASLSAACFANRSAHIRKVSGAVHSSKRMADGKQWMSDNLNVNADGSYCFGDTELNCARYGRIYTWESAQRVCQSLGDGWRLPSSDEWQQMAKHYGGIGGDSDDKGRAAFTTLMSDGSSGFNAVLGGNRTVDGKYERLEAHGFYWTASETDPTKAIFYNFGKGSQGLYRQDQGEKQMAISVRCVRE